MKRHFQQIDVAKGVAIVSVLLLHSLTRTELLKTYAIFHIWQAVPLFMVLMGLNLGLSVQGRQQELGQLYTREYFTKKATRILYPFLIIFLFSIGIGLLWQWLQKEDVLEFGSYTWVGVLPVTGSGNYFITLLLQSVLLLPIIGYAFRERPVLTTAVLVLLEVLFQVWAADTAFFDSNAYLYSAAFPRYFSAVAYGLWLARVILQPIQWRNLLVLSLLAVLSAVCLYWLTYQKPDIGFLLRPGWQAQQVLTFGYAAFLVWLALRALPSYSSALPLRLLAELGKASYHIFLVQVVYFGLVDQDLPLLLNLLVCLSAGYFFFRYEQPISSFLLFPLRLAGKS